jgi:hypothetical protein
MLLLVYLIMICLAFALVVLSFTRGETFIYELFPLLAMALFFILGTTSYNIEIPTCEVLNATLNEWGCYVYRYNDSGMATLFYGLGLFMLAYSVIMLFIRAGKAF